MLGFHARCLFGSLAQGRNENVLKNLIRADKKIATRVTVKNKNVVILDHTAVDEHIIQN